MEQKDNLLGVLSTLFKWKKQIIYVCVIAAVGSVVISLLLDDYYESSTIFYAASPDQALPEPVGIEAGDRKYYGEPEDIDRILSIAESKEIASFLINKYNLYEHYEIDTTHRLAQHKVNKAFRTHYNVKKTKYDAIEISVEDKDPILATQMVNDARQKVEQIAQGLIKNTMEIKIKTYKQAIVDKAIELEVIGDTLIAVRDRYGVYNTITQSEGLANYITKTESTLAREYARRGILANKSIHKDTIAMIDAMIGGMEKQLISLHKLMDKFNQGVSKVEVLEQIHQEARDQISLDKERLKQLEALKNSHINTVFIIEVGEITLYKSRPVRSIICIASVFIAFVLSVIAILILDVYKDVKWRELINAK
jgi:Chain length determinant protein